MKRLDKETVKLMAQINISNLMSCLEAEVTYLTCWDQNGKKTKKIVFEYTEDE